MKADKRTAWAVLGLVLISLLVGCTLPPQMADALQKGTMNLDGTTWTLVELRQGQGDSASARDLLPDDTVTLDFAEGKASGNGTCNRYSGSYEVDGERLSFGPLAGTMMACPGLNQETAYLEALETVAAYRVDGDQLVLLDAEGDAVATYSPTEHAALEGTTWQLTAYNMGSALRSVVPDSKITATWGQTSAAGAGEVTGSAGCNHYFGEYAVDGETLTVRAVGMTEMFCASPEGLMEQEQDYARVLGRAASYRIQGERLTVFGSDGERLLEFVAVAE
jgi:heat shock protein HslJ